MPNKSVSISDFTAIIFSTFTIAMGFISAYIAVLLKNITQKFERVKDNIAVLKEIQADHKKDLNEAFDRIRDLENLINVIKTEHDINHRRGKHEE